MLAACGSSTSGPTCGTGTMLDNGECVATGGSGNDTTCGTGTHLSGNTCVPDGPAAHGAPTITGMAPTEAGITGNGAFQIVGTNFAGADITDLHVYFGDTTPGTAQQPNPCEAPLAAASETQIGGQIPPACALSTTTTVTVVTNLGQAMTSFTYDALFAADGDGGGAVGQLGDLYIIDPFAQLYYDMGVMNDGTSGYGMNGIAFAANGTLYGVTTGDSPGDATLTAQLVTIAPIGNASGPLVTPLGDLVDAGGNPWMVTDIKFVNGTLFGWGTQIGATANQNPGQLVSIDTTTGAVTPIGTATMVDDYDVFDGGLAFDGTTLFAAGFGAYPDTTVGTTGVYNSVDMTTGALTPTAAPLDWGIGARVNAMANVLGTLVAVVDNGSYGAEPAVAATGSQFFGETLAIVDTTQTQIVSPAFELPAQIAAQSHVDALDMAPASLVVQRPLDRAKWSKLAASVAPTKH
ncbi:MAG: hypothetical protein ACM31C_01605 [Acidobacteriota bacterium]